MEYNFSGIYYRLWAVCGIIFLLGCVVLCFSKFWMPTRNDKFVITAVVLIFVAFATTAFYSSRLVNPQILVYEGYYEKEHRDSRVAPPLPLTMRYFFINDCNSENKSFYLDILSKSEIYPDDFREGAYYRVYYDEVTRIIVGIETDKNTELCNC